jgi:hypothetical protein
LISQPSPSLVFLWILVYEMPLAFMFLIRRDMFVVRRNCLLRSGSPQVSPVIQVAVIPFEIDVSRHVNLDDRAFPRFFPRMVIPNVVFQQLAVIFANGRCNNWQRFARAS